jgi:hypothetical protein
LGQDVDRGQVYVRSHIRLSCETAKIAGVAEIIGLYGEDDRIPGVFETIRGKQRK